jgi:hypothetical protein
MKILIQSKEKMNKDKIAWYRGGKDITYKKNNLCKV